MKITTPDQMKAISIIDGSTAAYGNKGGLVYHFSDDMKRFSRLTRQGGPRSYPNLVMGRYTYQSLPNGKLPDRRLHVVSSTHVKDDSVIEFDGRNVDRVKTITPEDLGTFTRYDWLIGGERLLRLAFTLELVDELYLTRVVRADGVPQPDADCYATWLLEDLSSFDITHSESAGVHRCKKTSVEAELIYQVYEKK